MNNLDSCKEKKTFYTEIEKLDLKANQEILEQKIKLDEQLKTDELEIAEIGRASCRERV